MTTPYPAACQTCGADLANCTCADSSDNGQSALEQTNAIRIAHGLEPCVMVVEPEYLRDADDRITLRAVSFVKRYIPQAEWERIRDLSPAERYIALHGTEGMAKSD